tara:strand:+ start:1555 stop:2100 length:546 start_codon:yes stop_codon:yes gene_type:complete
MADKGRFDKARSRSRDAFAEMDREIAKMNKSGELKVTNSKDKAPPKAKAPKAKAPPKAAPPKPQKAGPPKQQQPAAPPKQQPESNAVTKQYDDSVTKTTTAPTTRKGRKGTEVTTVSSGNVKGGKTDNPELQAISDSNRGISKYGNLVRVHGEETVRNTVKGTKSEGMFDKAYPKRKKKGK